MPRLTLIGGVALAVLLSVAQSGAASPRVILAKVVDAATGAPVDTASVLVERGEGAVADAAGKVTLSLPPGVRVITVIAPGYATRTVAVPAARPARAGVGVGGAATVVLAPAASAAPAGPSSAG
ncbi:MAG TPA: carboxypeptidase regulatory-like domain-containing protein, partial [Kofleriaceae bacterium]|nr:carboxypeptidase regulatory-like domain-containing protein [Kofleriaceae bacterium]